MKATVINALVWFGLAWWGAVWSLPALAQDQEGIVSEQEADQEQAGMMGEDMGRMSPEMEAMASSMKSMAEMCQTMMAQEMAYKPYIITAGAVLGAMVVIALALFIVLEVQWIRFWSLRIRTERKHVGQAP